MEKCAGHEKCCEGFGGQYKSPTCLAFQTLLWLIFNSRYHAFFFNQGEHMQIRQRVRKKKTSMRLQQHCTSFLHSLQHYCLSFFNNKCLITYSCTLFVQIKMKKKITSCVTEIWPTMVPSTVAQKGRWRVVLTVARLMRCFAAEPPRHVRPFSFHTGWHKMLVARLTMMQLKKKKKRRNQCSWHSSRW